MKTKHPFTASADADTPFRRITNPLEHSGGLGMFMIPKTLCKFVEEILLEFCHINHQVICLLVNMVLLVEYTRIQK